MIETWEMFSVARDQHVQRIEAELWETVSARNRTADGNERRRLERHEAKLVEALEIARDRGFLLWPKTGPIPGGGGA